MQVAVYLPVAQISLTSINPSRRDPQVLQHFLCKLSMPPIATTDQELSCSEIFFHLFTSPEDQPHTRSLIGIAVAIGGNILISLALNCQKLAHKRLELKKHGHRDFNAVRGQCNAGADSDQVSLSNGEEQVSDETRLLLDSRRNPHDSYTTPQKPRSRPQVAIPQDAGSPRRRSGLTSSHTMGEIENGEIRAVAIEITDGADVRILQTKHRGDQRALEEEIDIEHSETDYLRSKLWCVYSFRM
jgi:magnesium transporter